MTVWSLSIPLLNIATISVWATVTSIIAAKVKLHLPQIYWV